jgi:hypothetical protein
VIDDYMWYNCASIGGWIVVRKAASPEIHKRAAAVADAIERYVPNVGAYVAQADMELVPFAQALGRFNDR